MATDSIEQEIQAKGLTAPRVTPADIQAEIKDVRYFTAYDGCLGAERRADIVCSQPHDSLTRLTFAVITLRNGFTVTGESSCASPENFNAELGQKIARQNAEAKIWALLGFRLRDNIANGLAKAAE